MVMKELGKNFSSFTLAHINPEITNYIKGWSLTYRGYECVIMEEDERKITVRLKTNNPDMYVPVDEPIDYKQLYNTGIVIQNPMIEAKMVAIEDIPIVKDVIPEKVSEEKYTKTPKGSYDK
jgi:hypothetical protein